MSRARWNKLFRKLGYKQFQAMQPNTCQCYKKTVKYRFWTMVLELVKTREHKAFWRENERSFDAS